MLAPVELHEAIRRRAMVRSFSDDPVDRAVLDRIVQAALRSPTAGNTGGTAWVVLQGPAETAAYWESTTDPAWREGAGRARWPGLRRAPVVLLAYSSAAAYVARYAEADKSDPVLGASESDWPVPYWTGDAAFGVMTVLLAVVDAGLGACVLGAFKGTDELALRLGVPDDWRQFCAVVLGHPDGGDRSSASLARALPDHEARLHWGTW
jgi:nitroreductase